MKVHGEHCSPPRFWPWIFGQGQTFKAKILADYNVHHELPSTRVSQGWWHDTAGIFRFNFNPWELCCHSIWTISKKAYGHIIMLADIQLHACNTDKIREARLRWYGHVQRRDGDHCVKRILEAEVDGRRSRGKQRKRWIDTISQDLITLNLAPADAEDRDEWRRRTHVADLSPEGFTAWGERGLLEDTHLG